jgi:uncharacterized protein YjbJ (UPF0337 family)
MAESGPNAGAKGVVEGIKGKAKEVVGQLTDNDRLESEGKAQQDKAEAAREVAEHEAKADAARGKESLHEAEQRVHQTDRD